MIQSWKFKFKARDSRIDEFSENSALEKIYSKLDREFGKILNRS